MKIKAFILSLLLSGCGCNHKRDNKPDTSKNVNDVLLELTEKYCEWSRADYVSNGFVHSKCDGVGFTSLYSLTCPDVDLLAFEDEGKLYRSPTHDCYVKGRQNNKSKSESSRDMYLMRLIAAFEQKDIGYIERVIAFGKSVSWLMCDGDGIDGLSRCFLHTELRQMHYDSLKKLNGEDPPKPVEENNLVLPLLDGYQAHLEVIKIWLSGRIYEGITDFQLSRLRRYSERDEDNALFNAVYHRFYDGDFSNAIISLNRFPRNELPSGKQHCGEYIWQRSQDSDSWKPCNIDSFHSGTDFNFVIYVMTH